MNWKKELSRDLHYFSTRTLEDFISEQCEKAYQEDFEDGIEEGYDNGYSDGLGDLKA